MQDTLKHHEQTVIPLFAYVLYSINKYARKQTTGKMYNDTRKVKRLFKGSYMQVGI